MNLYIILYAWTLELNSYTDDDVNECLGGMNRDDVSSCLLFISGI